LAFYLPYVDVSKQPTHDIRHRFSPALYGLSFPPSKKRLRFTYGLKSPISVSLFKSELSPIRSVEEALLLPLNHNAFKLHSSIALPSLLLRTASSETAAVRHLSNLAIRSEGQLRPSYSTMSASTSSASSDDVRPRGQQPMLASQRAKEQTNASSAASRTSRFTGYFPLGYKEGFSQWVREPCLIRRLITY
jgi:hypothetical protein